MTRSIRFTVLILASLLLSPAAHAFDFYAHGYLRNRTNYFHDIDAQQPNANINQGGQGDNNRFGSFLYQQERLRLDPVLKVNDNVSVHATLDILDNVIAGTTNSEKVLFQSPIVGTIALPGAGGAIGVNGGPAGAGAALNIRRVWMDILTPAGKFRIGRQASNWGMGIFQNDGNDPLWGDYGDTFDRILYLSAVDLKDAGQLNFGALSDFVFTQQSDVRDGGIGQAITSPSKDMWQWAALLLYEYDTSIKFGTFTGLRFRNGTQGATTTTASSVLTDGSGQPILDANGNLQLGPLQAAGQDGDTRVWFTDLYGEYRDDTYRFRGEYVAMWGDMSTGIALDAIPFNGLPSNAYGPITLAPDSPLLVQMAAFEGEGRYDFGRWGVQGGYASGDADPLSDKITQYGFRPDYDIALLLFHTPMGASPRVVQANGNGVGSRTLVGAVPVTGNSVNNAIYGTFGYWHQIPLEKVVPGATDCEAGLKFITAWAAANTYELDFSEMTGVSGLPNIENSGKYYGWEVDGNFRSRFFDEALLFDLTAAYFNPGSAMDVKATTFNPGNIANVAVIPFDAADWVWGLRMSLIAEF